MLVHNTPVEDHLAAFGLLVKREDLSCPPPGPPFSKTRGVFAHVKARPESVIGVLDTDHSQGGHAVAQACALLGKTCVNFYPVRKADQFRPLQRQQQAARELGAKLVSLQAGRSAILYHQAKKQLATFNADSYMMPNALKLPEMVAETAREVQATLVSTILHPRLPVLISASSGTIAAGVIRGFRDAGRNPIFLVHQGYERPAGAILNYMEKVGGIDLSPGSDLDVRLINEGYAYSDLAKRGEVPPWPCNAFYDLKAFRWWLAEGRAKYGEALLWNIG
ncbi:threonine dehydratase [Pseudanabaena phage Pam3]|nr:threonine dehydratase [Pseudanabaena phage Pam3]